MAIVWWLFNTYPAAVQLMDNKSQEDVIASLLGALVASAAIAAVIRLLYVRFGRRIKTGVWRLAVTSPWMWTIAGVVSIVSLIGQLPQNGSG